MRRALTAACMLGGASLVLPAAAEAHGLVGRADLPVPKWLFGWAVATVLVISFGGLAALRTEPRFQQPRVRRLVRLPRWLDPACGAVGVVLFAGLVVCGLAGTQVSRDNLLPTFVYVLFWIGLVPLSVILGDVFRPFNPWRATGRLTGWALGRLAIAPPAPLPYPTRLGRWPAMLGLLVFGWFELVDPRGSEPPTLALGALAYAGAQLIGMSLYGVEAWTSRADAFAVYFRLLSSLSPLTVRDRLLLLRRPLTGIRDVDWTVPGTVAVVLTAIGITGYDGASEGAAWQSVASRVRDGLQDLGLSASSSFDLAGTLGLIAAVALVTAFYVTGIAGMRTVAPNRSRADLAQRFAGSLLPIAVCYSIAHYFSFAMYQSQAVAPLISNPLGNGADWFGTAQWGIDYGLITATEIWWVQVGALTLGHVLGLVLAHERALVEFRMPRTAVRSQYWMLAVMVGFTCFGLWLLSAANG
jgi:hypothetical protein